MEELVRRAIGVRLKEARQGVGQTQLQVATKLGVERQAVSAWEHGRCLPKSNEWFELGLLYAASLDYLVYGVRTMPVSKYAMIAAAPRPREAPDRVAG